MFAVPVALSSALVIHPRVKNFHLVLIKRNLINVLANKWSDVVELHLVLEVDPPLYCFGVVVVRVDRLIFVRMSVVVILREVGLQGELCQNLLCG